MLTEKTIERLTREAMAPETETMIVRYGFMVRFARMVEARVLRNNAKMIRAQASEDDGQSWSWVFADALSWAWMPLDSMARRIERKLKEEQA